MNKFIAKVSLIMRNQVGIMTVAAVCVSALLPTETRAALMLPDAVRIQFGGITAFDTAADPPINVADGTLFGVALLSGEVDITAIGRLTSIHEANNASNTGSMTLGGEVSVLFQSSLKAITGAEVFNSDPNQRSYVVSSTITAGILRIWDDSTQDLNIGDLVGTPLGDPPGIPGEVTDGDLYMDAILSAGSGTALLQVTFSRPDDTSNFDTITSDLQVLSVGGFDIIGGSILSAFPGVTGESINARQTAPGSPDFFPPLDLGGGLVINGPVDQLTEGGFDILFIVPEPGSALLLGIGGLLIARVRGLHPKQI